jgi:hypothetical protein
MPTKLQLSPRPPHISSRTEVCDFVATLAGKSQKDIKPLVGAAYGDYALLTSQLNMIIEAMKGERTTSNQRHSNMKNQEDQQH